MSVEKPADGIDVGSTEAVVASQLERVEPELAGGVVSLDVHMRRFVAVEAREEHPVWARDALDPWHSGISSLSARSSYPASIRITQAAERWRSAAVRSTCRWIGLLGGPLSETPEEGILEVL